MKGSPGMSCGCCTDTACTLQQMGPFTWMPLSGLSSAQTQVRSKAPISDNSDLLLSPAPWAQSIHIGSIVHASYVMPGFEHSVGGIQPNSPISATGGWGDFFATSDELVLDWTPGVEQQGRQECARIRASDVNDLLRKLDVSTAELDGMALTKVSCCHGPPALFIFQFRGRH